MLEVCIILSSTGWRCDTAWRWWYAGFELDGAGGEKCSTCSSYSTFFGEKHKKIRLREL